MIVRDFDTDARVLIIAEIGNNHEGDVEVARRLVREAAEAGADAVKFQTFHTELYVSAADAARFARLKGFELSEGAFRELADLARGLGLLFLSTPFDLPSAEYLAEIVDAFKIASGDNTFYPLLEKVAASGKPVIVSTGLADLAQVQRTCAFVEESWARAGTRGELAVLHCVSSYPVPAEQANLAAIRRLAETLPYTVGYSDHTMGVDAAVLAVAAGARIVEKHFTLDHHYSDFRDHQLSADPPELAKLVERVREAEAYLGSGEKALSACEEPLVPMLRRSIVAGRDLEKGHRIGMEDLTWIRPAGGLAPGSEDLLVGRTLVRGLRFGEPILEADVEQGR